MTLSELKEMCAKICDKEPNKYACATAIRAIELPDEDATVTQVDPADVGMSDHPAYGIIDPDYARVFTQARIVAWSYGYACVMHGSFTRDLDLLLVPWTVHAANNHEQLFKLIAGGCGLRFKDGVEETWKATVDFTDKPHGRKSCSLFFPAFGDRRWIDISVMPAAIDEEQVLEFVGAILAKADTKVKTSEDPNEHQN